MFRILTMLTILEQLKYIYTCILNPIWFGQAKKKTVSRMNPVNLRITIL